MNSDKDTRCRVGCPIRTSRDHRSLASPPGFSQRATSFIASQCQGIHQMPFLALDPRRKPKGQPVAFRRTKPPRTGAKPCFPRQRDAAPAQAGAHAIKRPHMKTLLRIGAQPWLRRAYPPRSHDKLSFHPSNNTPARVAPDGVLNLLQTPASPNAGWCPAGGGERIRTDDLLLAKQALSQLSYTPVPENSNQKSVIRISDHCLLITDLWQWWAREDLNLRPHAYQARALTS
jgi:hypothetical protein